MILKQKTINIIAFTLVELMISVAIIGLLSAVAIPAYQKYIINSKLTGGLLGLRELHDRQVIFVNTPISYRDATHGDVHCRSANRFATACMYIDRTGQSFPSRKKSTRQWFGYSKVQDSISYDPTTKICTGLGISVHTDPRLVMQEGADYVSNIINPNERIYIKTDPGYFAFRSWQNNILATEAGVPYTDTLMIWAISDLDGDVPPSANFNAYPCIYDPRSIANITLLGRSMYYQNGEIVSGAEILRVNVGE